MEMNMIDIEEKTQDQDVKLLKGFQTFLFEKLDEVDIEGKAEYSEFLEKMIPRTRTLINSMKKYIKNGVSYFDILYYLQPFLVFSDDITFKQYEEIVNFMRQNILNFKKTLVQNNGKYMSYINHDYGTDTSEKLSYLYSILDKSQQNVEALYRVVEKEEGKTSYSDPVVIRKKLNTSEFMKHILEVDNGNLFMSAVAFEDIELFISSDIDAIINQKLEQINEGVSSSESKEEECKNFVLAKKYIDLEELKEDDGKPNIYFDSKYDETRYEIIDEFSSEQANLSPSNFNDFLIEHLINNVGLKEENARIEAQALIDKKRLVRTGDYAFFTNDSGENMYYYRDQNNTWIHNTDLDGEDINAATFCNLKQNCMQIKDDCSSMTINKKKIQEQLMKDMLKQFNEEIHLDSQQLRTLFTERKSYFMSIINELMAIKYLNFIKYDKMKFDLAMSIQDRTVVVSPYEKIRDRILSQSDFNKKQTDIIKFIQKTCREANIENDESLFWFYCNKTGIKLLPTFYETLARAYYAGEYTSVLDRVCAERGTKSDDGDKIVDRHSGYLIRLIEFDEAEGFDEAGYRIVSRATMERDIADIILDMNFKPMQGLKSKDGQMIKNVVKTLEQQLSINILSSVDFIVKEVEETLDEFLPSQEDYEKQVQIAAQKRKRMASYIDLHDDALLSLTIAYFIVTVQTMIPSVKTDKTFRGCGPQSFTGYPLEGAGDYSCLKYIAYTALKLRSRTRPWKSLPMIKRDKAIASLKAYMMKIKNIIDSQVLSNHLVGDRITLKMNYLNSELEGDGNLAVEFNVRKWLTFLPPLVNVTTEGVQELGATFRENLLRTVADGSPEQFKMMNILSGRMTLFSMKIQQEIQKIIGRQSMLLSNVENDFLVENSCCNRGEKTTYKYLQEKEPNIKRVNDRVDQYNDIQKYIESLTIPAFLFDESDTKIKYPRVSKKFSERTMYSAFIRFCYFNSGIILNEEMGLVCGKNASAFKITDSIDEKIEILKKEGKDYDEASFLRLMDIINRQNAIKVDLERDLLSSRIIFENYIKNDEIKNDVDGSDLEIFFDLTVNLLDRYEVIEEEKKGMKPLLH